MEPVLLRWRADRRLCGGSALRNEEIFFSCFLALDRALRTGSMRLERHCASQESEKNNS
jgi:hypothetical protein